MCEDKESFYVHVNDVRTLHHLPLILILFKSAFEYS